MNLKESYEKNVPEKILELDEEFRKLKIRILSEKSKEYLEQSFTVEEIQQEPANIGRIEKKIEKSNEITKTKLEIIESIRYTIGNVKDIFLHIEAEEFTLEDELEELKIGKIIEEFEDSDPEKLEKEVDEMPYDHLKKMYEFLNRFLENHGDVIKKDYHSH